MPDWSYHSTVAAWWPYAFILVAGWLPTDVWRWLGVLSSGRVNEDSIWIATARAVATGLVAAVIARLVLYPSGSLATIPDWIRVGALVVGFGAYLWLGRQTLIAILFAELVLLGTPWLLSLS